MKELISIVVPCYNEEEVIEKYYDATIPVLEGLDVNYEIIFVDDGSKDNTAKLMKQLTMKTKLLLLRSMAFDFLRNLLDFYFVLLSKPIYFL